LYLICVFSVFNLSTVLYFPEHPTRMTLYRLIVLNTVVVLLRNYSLTPPPKKKKNRNVIGSLVIDSRGICDVVY